MKLRAARADAPWVSTTAPHPGVVPPTQRGFSSRKIGDVILDLGFASREVVEGAVAASRASGQTTGQALLASGTLTSEQLARVIAERFGLDYVDLAAYDIDPGATSLVSLDVLRRYEAIPVGWFEPGTLLVAMAEPSNVLALDDIALLTGCTVRPAIAAPDTIDLLLRRLGAGVDHVAAIVAEDAYEAAVEPEIEPQESANDAPVVRLVYSVLEQAIQRGASDVHFAPQDGDLRGQFRIDGVLVPAATVPRRMVAGVVSRIKIMADMDISERRIPQDGRISLTVSGREVDIRAVTLPLVGGESVVLRILDRSGGTISLEELGLPDAEQRRVHRACSRTNGALLVTGPTGSGKTTTLYAALQQMNTGERSIITIEDPVEYRMAGVKQMQVNVKAGVTFATGLRSMMRADPDVVMVGEIRDRETAQIGIEAALTGHLVLSTLHTNDAPSAVTRLVEMGVEPFLVASAVRCIVAQRLARRLCESCRRPAPVSVEVLRASGFDRADAAIDAFEPVGCPQCGGTGYRGRVGVYEVLDMDDRVHDLILHRGSALELADAAEAGGMRPLRACALERVRDGVTSVAEVTRVLGG